MEVDTAESPKKKKKKKKAAEAEAEEPVEEAAEVCILLSSSLDGRILVRFWRPRYWGSRLELYQCVDSLINSKLLKIFLDWDTQEEEKEEEGFWIISLFWLVQIKIEVLHNWPEVDF